MCPKQSLVIVLRKDDARKKASLEWAGLSCFKVLYYPDRPAALTSPSSCTTAARVAIASVAREETPFPMSRCDRRDIGPLRYFFITTNPLAPFSTAPVPGVPVVML